VPDSSHQKLEPVIPVLAIEVLRITAEEKDIHEER
jgi:hypothetical protein